MKYSVVIPLYNKEKYIQRTIQSVLRQTLKDFEIIVVNDGSTDESLKKALQMKKISDKIKIVDQKNQGVAVARNTGVENAEGRYIAFLDADDEWRSHYLETIDRLTDKFPESDFYVTAYCVVMGNGKYNYSSRLTPKEGCLESYWMTFQYPYDFVWTSATVIKKEAVLRAGGFQAGEKIGQDLDLWARVARNNPRVAYSSEVCVNYNRAAESNARTRVRIAYAGAFIKDLEEELNNSLHTKEELAMIQHKYDLKMTVYVFTCILAGEKKRAEQALKSWRGKFSWKRSGIKTCLRIAGIMPAFLNRWLYAIRLKVF